MEQSSTRTVARPQEAQEAEPLGAVRPRLRHDVVFAESPDGVLLRHSDHGFLLKGRSAYRLVSSLSPYLTGEHTVAELCAGLGRPQADMVTATVRTNSAAIRGLVRNGSPSGMWARSRRSWASGV